MAHEKDKRQMLEKQLAEAQDLLAGEEAAAWAAKRDKASLQSDLDGK